MQLEKSYKVNHKDFTKTYIKAILPIYKCTYMELLAPLHGASLLSF